MMIVIGGKLFRLDAINHARPGSAFHSHEDTHTTILVGQTWVEVEVPFTEVIRLIQSRRRVFYSIGGRHD